MATESMPPSNQSISNIQIGDNSNVIVGTVQSQGGITINSKSAIHNGVIGQTKKSLRPVAHYVRRPGLQKELENLLHATLDIRGLSSKVVVICGLGGAGKSQLALNYVQTYREDYAAVFWIEADSKETLERDYVQIWRVLSNTTQDIVKIDDAVRGVKSWFREKGKRWLLVFDSADSIDDRNHKSYVDLDTFIPEAPHVDVIITTRSQTAKHMTEIAEVQVGDLSEAEALELLLRSSGIKAPTERTKHEATLIVKELGHFALAVVLAGSYIGQTPRIRSHLETYLPEYRKRRKTTLGRRTQRHIHQYGESVLTTWEASHAAIADQCPEAVGLLRLLAFLNSDDIFYELFAPLIDRCAKGARIWSGEEAVINTSDAVTHDVLDDGLEALSRYSLLSWKEEQTSFAMHKLVHTWGFDRMNDEEQVGCGQEALLFVRKLLDWQVYEPQMKTRLMPHVMTCFARLQEWHGLEKHINEKALQTLEPFTNFLHQGAYLSQAAVLSQFRHEIFTQRYSGQHKEALVALNDLARVYSGQGRWKEAEELGLETVEARNRVLGADHPDTLISMGNLVSVYCSQGRWKDAEELELKVVGARRKVLGADHPDTLNSMANLASVYLGQGRWKDAEELELKVLGARRKVFSADHPSTLTGMANLASVYYSQGRWKEAEELGLEVVEARKRVLGADHPSTLNSMGNLVSVYWGQGRWKEAEELGLEVAETRRRVLGVDHPDTLGSMGNLVSVYWSQGRWKEAGELGLEVVAAERRVLGVDHPNTLISMGNLMSVYWGQGRWKEAEELGLKVVKTRRRVLGSNHPDTLTGMANLAHTYWLQNRLLEAEDLMRQCAELRLRVLGSTHPYTRRSMEHLENIQRQLEATQGDEAGPSIANLTPSDNSRCVMVIPFAVLPQLPILRAV